MSGHVLPLKIAPSHGDLEHDLIRGSLGTPDSASQTIDSAVLEQLTANSPYMLQWDPFAPKLVFCMDPHLIHDSLGPPESSVKRHIERFIRCCTAHGIASLYFRIGRTSPLKVDRSHADDHDRGFHADMEPGHDF